MTHHHRRDEWAEATERERAHLLFSLLLAMEEKLMTVSAEVQKILDDVKQNKDIVASVDTGMKALQQQVKDLQDQIANQTPSLSAEDKAALTSAASDLESSISTLQSDIPANTTPAGGSGGSGGGSGSSTGASGASSNVAPPVPPVGAEGAPTGMPGNADAASANGPSNHPAGGSAPLMPTIAFDPNPTATAASVLAGQPPSTFPSAGGFVTNPPQGQAGSGPAGSAGAVAPTSVVPNAAGGVTVLAGQVGPGAPISNIGGVESATDAEGKPLATSGAIPKDGVIADAEGAPPPPPVNPVVLGTVVPPSPDQVRQAGPDAQDQKPVDPTTQPNAPAVGAPPASAPVSPPPTFNPPPGSPSNPQTPAV